MTVDPNIQQKADYIRTKKKGSEVRESLASGLEAMSEDVVENKKRQDTVEHQFQEVINNTTDKDVISAPEIIAARNGKSNLKQRLDDEHQQVTRQLAQTDQHVQKLSHGVAHDEESLRTHVNNGVESIRLSNDIVLSSKVDFSFKHIRFDLNGFKITLSDDFTDDHIFTIGDGEGYNNPVEHLQKHIYNGRIDCNDRFVSVLKYGFSWDLKCWDLTVYKCGVGFITYTDKFETDYENRVSGLGVETFFDNITIEHSDLYDNDSVGFDIAVTDSYCSRLIPYYFRYGIINRGSSNVYDMCHPWGSPRTRPVSQQMRIGFVNLRSSASFTNCYADTYEPSNPSDPPSYQNGGIGFYSIGTTITLIRCSTREHPESADNTLIPYFFDDVFDGLTDMSNDIYLTNCKVSRDNAKRVKPIHFVGRHGITLLGCNFNLRSHARNSNRLVANQTIFHNPSSPGSDWYNVPENNTFKLTADKYQARVVHRDEDGNAKTYTAREMVGNTYSYNGLINLRTRLVEEKNFYGETDRTGMFLAVLRTGSGENTVYDLVMWIRALDNFVRVKDGTLALNPI